MAVPPLFLAINKHTRLIEKHPSDRAFVQSPQFRELLRCEVALES
jgi:hypothetical protein